MTNYIKEFGYQMGVEAASEINWNIPLGLGAGRTIQEAMRAFVKEGFYRGSIVSPASKSTRSLAKELGMTLCDIDELGNDFTYIDGADRIDPGLRMIKGAYKGTGDPGKEGCMSNEKRIAERSSKFIVLADESKMVIRLGHDGVMLPVEYYPEREESARAFVASVLGTESFGPRMNPDDTLFVTENGCYIFDVPFAHRDERLEDIERALESNDDIKSTGLFSLRKPDLVICATIKGIKKYY